MDACITTTPTNTFVSLIQLEDEPHVKKDERESHKRVISFPQSVASFCLHGIDWMRAALPVKT